MILFLLIAGTSLKTNQIQTMNQTKNPMTRTTIKLFFSKNKIKKTLKQTTGPKICVNNNSHPLEPENLVKNNPRSLNCIPQDYLDTERGTLI